ncbi:hypothetical protein ACQKWADRAFT_295224 [Trichoderma austrokoningii]
MYPRSFLPAEDDAVLRQQWNDATSSLRMQIMEAVNVADWTAIDILRVGLREEFRNTLLIAVTPDSMSWQEGHSLALRCKAILEEHGIIEIHCEIRESVATLCADTPTADISSAPAAAAAAAPTDFQLSSEPIIRPYPEYRADLSDCLGTKIAMKDLNYVVGTKGLYLALAPSTPEGEPRIVALTCRHVAIGSQNTQEYRHEHPQPYKEVIQVDQPTYQRMTAELEPQPNMYRSWGTQAAKRGDTRQAADHTEVGDQIEALQQCMVRYAEPSSRIFGRLLYSPGFDCKSENGSQWLRDWALIELLPNSHQAPLSSLGNKVFVGVGDALPHLIISSERGWRGLPPPVGMVVSDGTISLTKDLVPMSQLIKPPHFTEYGDERPILVAKYGAKGGLTLGLGSTLVSVVRWAVTSTGQRYPPSEEWCISSASATSDRQVAFSKPGDSGSCIWDMDGRIAGILMGGNNGQNGLNDVTYAQPFERLLANIRGCVFDVSLL